MTDEMMNLRSLVEKTPDGDFLREMIAFASSAQQFAEVLLWFGARLDDRQILFATLTAKSFRNIAHNLLNPRGVVDRPGTRCEVRWAKALRTGAS